MNKQNTISKLNVKEITSRHISNVDKFYRMYAGLASNLERYENGILYLRIENTENKLPSNYKTALQISNDWLKMNKELSQAKGFIVSFYSTKSTGFVFNQIDLKDENKIKTVVEELKSISKKELINIFSGLFTNK